VLGEKIKEAKEELEKWDLKGEISDLSEEELALKKKCMRSIHQLSRMRHSEL